MRSLCPAPRRSSPCFSSRLSFPIFIWCMLLHEVCGGFAVCELPDAVRDEFQALVGKGWHGSEGWCPVLDGAGRLTDLWQRPACVEVGASAIRRAQRERSTECAAPARDAGLLRRAPDRLIEVRRGAAVRPFAHARRRGEARAPGWADRPIAIGKDAGGPVSILDCWPRAEMAPRAGDRMPEQADSFNGRAAAAGFRSPGGVAGDGIRVYSAYLCAVEER